MPPKHNSFDFKKLLQYNTDNFEFTDSGKPSYFLQVIYRATENGSYNGTFVFYSYHHRTKKKLYKSRTN